jgi:hypothetical protein
MIVVDCYGLLRRKRRLFATAELRVENDREEGGEHWYTELQ